MVRRWGWVNPALGKRPSANTGWDVSRKSLAKLESQFRRVPDCELLFLAKVLEVRVGNSSTLAAWSGP